MKHFSIYLFLTPLLSLVGYFFVSKKGITQCAFNRRSININYKPTTTLQLPKNVSQIRIDPYGNFILNCTDHVEVRFADGRRTTVLSSTSTQPYIGISLNDSTLAVHEANLKITLLSMPAYVVVGTVSSPVKTPVRRHQLLDDGNHLMVALNETEQPTLYLTDATSRILAQFAALPLTTDRGVTTEGYFNKGANGAIFYRFAYRDSIVVFDVKMRNVAYIKPVDSCHLKPEVIQDHIGFRPGKNMQIMRKSSTNYGGKLFVVSNFLGANQSEELVRDKHQIDVYSEQARTYLGSFFLTKKAGGLSDITFDKRGILYALYKDGTLQTYQAD